MKEILNTTLFELGGYHIEVGNLVAVAIILAGIRLLLYLINALLNRRVRLGELQHSSAYATMQILKYLFWTLGIVFSMQAIGVNVSILLAGSAALLVGLGFGLQQTFSDFVSGIILLIDSSIKIDDVLEFDGMVCKVSKIGVRTSTVINRDDIYIIVPNSRFTSDKVINWSHSGQLARFNVKVGVHYNTDSELVKKCLLECAALESDILKTPEPMVRLESFDDSSIAFGLYFWTHAIFSVEKTCSELRFKIVKSFREHNIEIPYPQSDLHIKHITQPIA